MNKIKFWLNGCDIAFIAEAPEDMTVKQLVEQADKIHPDWCACGIKSANAKDEAVEIIFDYNSVKKANEDVTCRIYKEIIKSKT